MLGLDAQVLLHHGGVFDCVVHLSDVGAPASRSGHHVPAGADLLQADGEEWTCRKVRRPEDTVLGAG
jgi:hypothetical protein